jgi:hypothetical protein
MTVKTTTGAALGGVVAISAGVVLWSEPSAVRAAVRKDAPHRDHRGTRPGSRSADTPDGRHFSRLAGDPTPEVREVSKKAPEDRLADLIDLLLDADEPTRRLLLFQALQSGAVKKSQAEEVIAQVARLERAAAPRQGNVTSAQAA